MILARLGHWSYRIICIIGGLWLAGIVFFALLPVPFSAVMLERQLSAWCSGDFQYEVHQDWVSMDDISPQIALAVIASEDQKFPTHWVIRLEINNRDSVR